MPRWSFPLFNTYASRVKDRAHAAAQKDAEFETTSRLLGTERERAGKLEYGDEYMILSCCHTP